MGDRQRCKAITDVDGTWKLSTAVNLDAVFCDAPDINVLRKVVLSSVLVRHRFLYINIQMLIASIVGALPLISTLGLEDRKWSLP